MSIAKNLSPRKQRLHQIDIAVSTDHVAIVREEFGLELRTNFLDPIADRKRDLAPLDVFPAAPLSIAAYNGVVIIDDDAPRVGIATNFKVSVVMRECLRFWRPGQS